MTDALPSPPNSNVDPHARWKFIRDVAVFEAKLALNNLHNFFQIPLTLAVAVFDLVVGGKTEGERFYINSIDDYVSDLSQTIELARSRHPARGECRLGDLVLPLL